MRRWDGITDDFMTRYISKGVGDSSIETMWRELEKFGCWSKRKKPRPKIEEIDTEMITDYLRIRSKFKSASTIYSMISRLRQMGDYLVQEGYWIKNPLKWIKGPRSLNNKRVPRRIESRKIQRLLETAATRRQDYYSYLWVTALMILYSVGLRRGELARLNTEDWDLKERSLKIKNTKTGLDHWVPVPEVTASCIEAYLPRRHNMLERQSRLDDNAFFISNRGGRVEGEYLSRGIHRLAKEAGFPLKSLHQFRHSCASDLMEAGVKMPMIQKMLGHKRIETTMRYLHIADPQRQDAINRHPINGMLELSGVLS